MKHLPLIVLFVCLFTGFSCTKPYTPVQIPCTLTRNMDSIKLHIEGKWEWVETLMSFRGSGDSYETPHSEGYRYTLELSHDTAWYFRNGARDSVYRYKIALSREITNEPQDTTPVIVFYNLHSGLRSSYLPLSICRNYLVFHFNRSVAGHRIWKK
jgi:hypothetical protein